MMQAAIVVVGKLPKEEQDAFWSGHKALWEHATGTSGGNLSRLSSMEDFLDFRVSGFEHLIPDIQAEAAR